MIWDTVDYACLVNFLIDFSGMKWHTQVATQLDVKLSLFSDQIMYKLLRIVQLASWCFQFKSDSPRCPNLPEVNFPRVLSLYLFIFFIFFICF